MLARTLLHRVEVGQPAAWPTLQSVPLKQPGVLITGFVGCCREGAAEMATSQTADRGTVLVCVTATQIAVV
jgi:hypothetical protein